MNLSEFVKTFGANNHLCGHPINDHHLEPVSDSQESRDYNFDCEKCNCYFTISLGITK